MVRRLIIVAVAGVGAVGCLAFAKWIRPNAVPVAEEVATECEEIRANGEEEAGELATCELKLVQLRATQR